MAGLGTCANKINDNVGVRNMAQAVANTFAMASTFFIMCETNKPPNARLATTHIDMKECPANTVIGHACIASLPLESSLSSSHPPNFLKSKYVNLALLNNNPNAYICRFCQ